MEIRVDGFSHKLPLLVKRVFSCIAGKAVEEGGDGGAAAAALFTEAAFAREKEALVRKYRNANMQVGVAGDNRQQGTGGRGRGQSLLPQ